MSIKLKLKLIRMFSCCCCFKGLAGKKRIYIHKVAKVVVDSPLIRRTGGSRQAALRMAHELHSRTKEPQYRIVWVDLEMTGLDVDTDHILEMACVITDSDMNVLKEAPTCVIHQPEEVLQRMNDWCVNQHQKSGLTQAVRESTMSLTEASETMVKFIQEYTPQGKCPLAGNSVHVDRMFLMKYMKPFIDHLHYRIIDVSSIKELCRRWYPDIALEVPIKQGNHRASYDIYKSVEEMKFYRRHLFK